MFGLVAPVGTDLETFQIKLSSELRALGYTPIPIRLSDFLDMTSPRRRGESEEAARLRRAMDAGNELRRKYGGEALVARAVTEINARRKEPSVANAYILRSLKHPAEVYALRRTYDAGFLLIGVLSGEDSRRNYLVRRLGLSSKEAEAAIQRDHDEENEVGGQKTRDTFHLADVFIPLKGNSPQTGLKRFLELLFGYPFHSPTPDEFGMFQAYGASLNSLDLGRQVGASILNQQGDLIAVGYNDVPRFGGGLYQNDGSADERDYRRKVDSNVLRREEIVAEIVGALRKSGHSLSQEDEASWRERLKSTRLFDLTEFGRAVHAEMSALLACARSGVSPLRGTLFSTTFPCHNCAKHIVAAGIERVLYIEPYPESLASDLHDDAIAVREDAERRRDRVVFEPFTGVGPRRFFDLFSMRLGSGESIPRKDKATGRIVSWDPISAFPRSGLVHLSYIEREQKLIDEHAEVSGGTE